MNCARALAVSLAVFAGLARAEAADATPVLFQSAPGRFEVAATDAAAAQGVVTLAGEAWAMLAAPLALPERFSSPIFVRLVPAADWGDPAAFRVIVEAGGVVSLRLRWGEESADKFVRRALVQALLMRLAVALHGVNEKLTVPLWLEHACVGWWRTHAEAAQLDALKQETARLAAPPLGPLLAWPRGQPEPRAQEVGAVWLLTFLQSESGKAGEWHAMLGGLLGGESPDAAVAANFPGRFLNESERELWWQTGWHQLRRANTLPTLEAAQSRMLLADAARFVFAQDDGTDVVTPLRTVLEHAREPLVDLELARRAAELGRLAGALHPFYRNAGISLTTALGTRTDVAATREGVCAAFEQDWRDATELAAATKAALDRLEVR